MATARPVRPALASPSSPTHPAPEILTEILSQADIAVAMTQRELGQLVGAAEVSVQKALRRLSAEGLLTPRYGRIVITRPNELRRAAGG